jgi:mxaJ protein
VLAFVLLACTLFAHATPSLRICADPDDLPFSSQGRAGFDNRIAALLAHDLGKQSLFVWSRSRRGFLRERFNKGACDVLMGVPLGMKHIRTTQPYYRSSYVFLARSDDSAIISRFDDPAIGMRRIGLQMLEEDYSPPSLPLVRAGHAAQLVGFDSFGCGAASIVQAVARRRVGLAVVWGPIAGYYAAHSRIPLTIRAVQPDIDSSGIPFSFDIAVAVHSGDVQLADELNRAIVRNRGKIQKILNAYHVPVDRGKEGG